LAKPWWDKDSTTMKDPRPIVPKEYQDRFGIADAKAGYCPVDCKFMYNIMLGLLILVAIISSGTRVPNALIFLRVVKPEDKVNQMAITVVVSFHSLSR